MGAVYLAMRDGETDLCVLKQRLGGETDEAMRERRFKREGIVAQYLRHPNIARTLGTFSAHGRSHIAMEYVPGIDFERLMLRHRSRAQLVPYELTLAMADGVLAGLQAIHTAADEDGKPLDLVHRDLSPRNIMISFAGRVVIIDFGLVKANLGDFRTQAGITFGTFQYIAPEQARAEPTDGRSDLYVLGAILYEALSGVPVVGEGLSPKATLLSAALPSVKPLGEIATSLPEALCSTVMKALAPNPADRWQNAALMRDALRAATPSMAPASAEDAGAHLRATFESEAQQAQAYVRQAAIWARKQRDSLEPPPVVPHDINAYEEFAQLTDAGSFDVKQASPLAPAAHPQTAVRFESRALARPASSNRTRIAGAAGLAIGAAVTALVLFSREPPKHPAAASARPRSDEGSVAIGVVPAKALADAAPSPEPRPSAPMAQRPLERPPKPPVPKERVAPPSTNPPPRSDAALARLRRNVGSLQAGFDSKLFESVVRDLRVAVESAPAEDVPALRRRVEMAWTAQDDSDLAAIVEQLERR